MLFLSAQSSSCEWVEDSNDQKCRKNKFKDHHPPKEIFVGFFVGLSWFFEVEFKILVNPIFLFIPQSFINK